VRATEIEPGIAPQHGIAGGKLEDGRRRRRTIRRQVIHRSGQKLTRGEFVPIGRQPQIARPQIRLCERGRAHRLSVALA